MTSQAAMRTLAKCLQFSFKTPLKMTSESVQYKLSSAYKEYNLANQNFPKWREEFQVNLEQALASEKDKSPEAIIAQMKRKKHQKIFGTKYRTIRQKNKNDPILQATATNENGLIYKCTDKKE